MPIDDNPETLGSFPALRYGVQVSRASEPYSRVLMVILRGSIRIQSYDSEGLLPFSTDKLSVRRSFPVFNAALLSRTVLVRM
jgi:hypothetical protein